MHLFNLFCIRTSAVKKVRGLLQVKEAVIRDAEMPSPQ